MSAKIKDIDRGWEGIKKRLSFAAAYTKVGLPQDGEMHTVPGSDVDKLDDLVIVYAANEFGTKRIPERATLRPTTDKNRQQIANLQTQVYNNIMRNKMSVKQGLSTIGAFLTGKVQGAIVNLRTPPNAPSTLKNKYPKTNPLIHKGQLVQSIQHSETVV